MIRQQYKRTIFTTNYINSPTSTCISDTNALAACARSFAHGIAVTGAFSHVYDRRKGLQLFKPSKSGDFGSNELLKITNIDQIK
ncbi:hypothetical protein [Litoribacillus peritrichatus]|uniref:Uncharacterized protein n=1 Tax=Litoribacillus peritrichatus TaxID=718191 RepID=A0ABP7MUI8_9GAMM